MNNSGIPSHIAAQKDDRSLKSSKSHVKNIKDFHYLTGKAY